MDPMMMARIEESGEACTSKARTVPRDERGRCLWGPHPGQENWASTAIFGHPIVGQCFLSSLCSTARFPCTREWRFIKRCMENFLHTIWTKCSRAKSYWRHLAPGKKLLTEEFCIQ